MFPEPRWIFAGQSSGCRCELMRCSAPFVTRSGIHCLAWRVAAEADAFLHDVQRPLLYLFVDAADVLAEDADRDELDAAEEQHAQDDRREAAARLLAAGDE